MNVRLAEPGPLRQLTPADPTVVRFADDNTVVLLGSYSPTAQQWFWPRRHRCPVTGAAVEDVELAARGTIWSWTYVETEWRGAQSPSAGNGYGAALVDLPEGTRVPGLLIGDMGDWKVGDDVVMVPLVLRSDDTGDIATVAWRKQDPR